MFIAEFNGEIIAQANKEEILMIEGNVYFPPSSITSMDFLKKSELKTNCPWKGDCNYFNVEVDGQEAKDGVWVYPKISETAKEMVSQNNDGKDGDFSGYFAFWNGVEVSEV